MCPRQVGRCRTGHESASITRTWSSKTSLTLSNSFSYLFQGHTCQQCSYRQARRSSMEAAGPRAALSAAPARGPPVWSVVPGSVLRESLLSVLVAASDSRLGEGALRGPGDGGAVDGGSDAHTADLGCGAHEGHVDSIGLAGAAEKAVTGIGRGGRALLGWTVGWRSRISGVVCRPFQFLHQPSAKRGKGPSAVAVGRPPRHGVDQMVKKLESMTIVIKGCCENSVHMFLF